MTSTVSSALYAACAAALLALWGLSRVRPGAVVRPSQPLLRVLGHPAGRVAAGLVYMWVGWHLFAR